MKKAFLFKTLIVSLGLLLLFSSCDKDDDETDGTARVTIIAKIDGQGVDVDLIFLEDLDNDDEYWGATGSNGVAVFDGLEPGTYDVNISVEYNGDEYHLMSDHPDKHIYLRAGDNKTYSYELETY